MLLMQRRGHAGQCRPLLSAVTRRAHQQHSTMHTSKKAANVIDATVPAAAQMIQPNRRSLSTATASDDYEKVLSLDRINPKVKAAKYAVRGELAIRAEELRRQLEERPGSLPFSKIINCNIGNPQQLKQKPITFFRQVCALLEWPEVLEDAHAASQIFPADAVERARLLLAACGGSIGAYSHSKGIPLIRQHVAEFLERRDGFAADPEHLFLTNGASEGVKAVLDTLIESSNVGVLIPIPQYPLYTASLALFDAKAVPYYLEEGAQWSLSADSIAASVTKARAEGVDVRALVVINPGNPVGNCLTVAEMEQIVRICYEHKLVLMADEVYQTNIFMPEERPFVSFKKVLMSMPGYISSSLELFSFNSVSKGFVGECGHRGGYFEAVNIDKEVLDQLYKMASINLCPNVQGQALVDLMVNPPREGEDSFALYARETAGIQASLARRAEKLRTALNTMTGVSCAPAQGAMYLFPQVQFSEAAKKAAAAKGKSADEVYAMALLEATGICVVPGSGFGQKEGTFHFRATFLPPEEQFDDFLSRFRAFHEKFMM